MNTSQYPVLEPFLTYMFEEWESKLNLNQLEWLGSLDANEVVFASYILTSSGAWEDEEISRKVAETAMGYVGDYGKISNDGPLVDELASVLEEADKSDPGQDWITSHRERVLVDLGRNWRDICEHTISEWNKLMGGGKFDSPEEWLADAANDSVDTFNRMFSDLDSIDRFGRVAKFDQLEICSRGGNLEQLQLLPGAAKRSYIYDSYPKQGFMIVYCSDEASVQAAEVVKDMGWWDARDYLGLGIEGIDELLQETAKELVRRGWSKETAVFDLESCLCLLSKTGDYRSVLEANEAVNPSTGC